MSRDLCLDQIDGSEMKLQQDVAQTRQTNSYVMHEQVADDTYLAVLPETCHNDSVSPDSAEDTYADIIGLEDTSTAQYQILPDTADNSRSQSFSGFNNADSMHVSANLISCIRRGLLTYWVYNTSVAYTNKQMNYYYYTLGLITLLFIIFFWYQKDATADTAADHRHRWFQRVCL
jgi:hypothetical protein